MSRDFLNIAKLVKQSRQKVKLTQTELSYKLGFKNGQFVSNIERGICSIPSKAILKVAVELNIQPQEIIDAMVQDFNEYLMKITKIE